MQNDNSMPGESKENDNKDPKTQNQPGQNQDSNSLTEPEIIDESKPLLELKDDSQNILLNPGSNEGKLLFNLNKQKYSGNFENKFIFVELKSVDGKESIRSKIEKIEENKNKLNVTLHSSVLNYVDQKHNLSLNVGSQYARKIVEVELKPNSTSSNRSSIKSAKVASDTKGNTTVVFSGLEHNKSYYVSAVNIYEDLRKTTPIVSNSYLENVLVVKTPSNNKEQSSNKQIEPDDKQSSNDQTKQNEQPNPSDQKDSGSSTETPTPNKQMNSDDKNGSDNKTHNQNNNESSTNNLDSNNQTNPVPDQNNSIPKLNNSNPGFDPNVPPDLNALLEQFKKQREQADRLNRPASKVVEELKIKPEQAYEKIKNRSFAIGFNSVDYTKENNGGINDSVVSFEPTGTSWLLDYAWKNGVQNSDELMLYIATNAHVYKRAFNAIKDDEKHRKQFPEYFTQKDQKQARIDSFVLAIPKREANLDAIESGTSYGTSNDLEYFINTKDSATFSLDKGSKQITFDDSKVF
ncbi:hypothetical protein JM47_03710 [Ureaplasma diversum]|uniref:DUF31 domain-containing protein n=1 Tax=Ureaplasma diversum TaxID=42094 RepID=A0A0C5RQD7_9BACT|nr:hypothetical protein [Ureaplasma diversum]AJQ45629.1 hypothetical protein JM47_03710 [Ureaplasma diversum]